ncbi:MAG: sugar ABC transporter substrate-binding protein [Planctomycetota bacterium]|jgi:ribose transport system substrate-binding protein|nr:sugar ABC transporter substrate-binding protein [Planctomycetota bacterium]
MKKWALLACVMAAVIATGVAEAATPRKFGFTCMTMNNPFFTTIESSVRREVEKDGNILITYDTKQDIATQINQVEDMINQGIELLFLCPVDSDGILPALDMLAGAKIPVINFDTDVKDTDLVETVLVSNNEHAGFIVGQALAKKFPNGGKIAILDAPYAEACVIRVNGFKKGMGDKFTIVSQQNGKGDIGESLPIAEAILQTNSDLVAFFCVNDPSALGALSAVEGAGLRGKVAVYGVDGSPDAKKSIKEGGMTATGAQSPIGIGVECVKAGKEIMAGKKVEKEIKVPTFLIDASNVDEYGIDGWQ